MLKSQKTHQWFYYLHLLFTKNLTTLVCFNFCCASRYLGFTCMPCDGLGDSDSDWCGFVAMAGRLSSEGENWRSSSMPRSTEEGNTGHHVRKRRCIEAYWLGWTLQYASTNTFCNLAAKWSTYSRPMFFTILSSRYKDGSIWSGGTCNNIKEYGRHEKELWM